MNERTLKVQSSYVRYAVCLMLLLLALIANGCTNIRENFFGDPNTNVYGQPCNHCRIGWFEPKK